MTKAYLGKMYVQFLELPFLKCNEDAVFLFKNTYNKEKQPFLFEIDLKVVFFVMFGSCSYFINKALNRVYSKQLRSYDTAN